jgi:hydrophobic/amphiphilic exporter-1 (mainly G- bacteria), HAE1 family
MDFIRGAIQQPVTVAVGVILIILAGLVAITRIPVQLTPSVEDTIITVTTTWEGASPQEIEQDVVNKQEEKLQGLSNLRHITSECQQGQGIIRLEFVTGTHKDDVLRAVGDKLREVPSYPENVDEPVVEASDRMNRDYIAWIIFATTDPNLDVRTLQDFVEDRIKPALERIEGMSEIGVLGGYEREAQIRFDPRRLAERGITPPELVRAIEQTNRDVSAGQVADAKSDVRLRTISQYESIEDIERTLVKNTSAGPIYLSDVADVVEAYKEARSFVRSKGQPVIAINAQREIGSNVMDVMQRLREEIARINLPGGMLDSQARRLGLGGKLTLTQVYDQTVYIDDALALVRDNIWVGGILAVLILLVFLRSIRSVGIIALAIPISVIGAFAVMVALGRTINVISLAGMAFAVGMVVDNAIVVLENIFRHLEIGKKPRQAAYDAAREVWGAVLASTLTTLVVFIPILLIKEEAGQLFRDIALAICAAVTLSLAVSILVVPCAAARVLKPKSSSGTSSNARRFLTAPLRLFDGSSTALGRVIYLLCGSLLARVVAVIALTLMSIVGTYWLMPPSDYLPTGNRNLVFGMMFPPPGYNLEQQNLIAERVEQTMRPYWQAAEFDPNTPEYEAAAANLPEISAFDFASMSMISGIKPAPIDNYFFVGFDGIMFHGAISDDPQRVVDLMPLFQHATRAEMAPGVLAFAMQVPLFQLGGSTGSAVKIDFSGADLDKVAAAAGAAYGELIQKYGVYTVQPSPSNFNLPGPEMQIVPNRKRLAEVGMTPTELGVSVQAAGDGRIIGEYRIGGETIDLKLIASAAVNQKYIEGMDDAPIATPSGAVVPLSTLADIRRVTSPPQINRINRQRSVTLEFTAPRTMPLEQAISDIDQMLAGLRQQNRISPDVETGFTGSASKLKSVQQAMLGDGSFLGTINSSVFLALLVTYLLMCVLFQSWLEPLVIMFSVPLATLGGFAALRLVYLWSEADRYMPVQKLDVVTMLGFVILIGVVVNNAILIVHQARNFMRGISDVEDVKGPLTPRRAIAESVRTRLRPIMMSTLTSVLGMAPLVLMPGAGSELYRGLGAVVLGGLLVSTIFTLILVPLLLSLVLDAQQWFRGKTPTNTPPLHSSEQAMQIPEAHPPHQPIRDRTPVG